MGSINIEEAMPTLPSNLMPETSDGYHSKTLDAGNRRNQDKSIAF